MPYPKLSVKLYGRGVSLDHPADGSALKMKRHQLAKAGQVILSEIWGKKGAVGFVPNEGEGALCTSHFFLFDVNEESIDPRYLQAIFSSNFLQEQLDAEARGTTGYAAVRPHQFLAAAIPLPPLAEQRRIVARIEAVAGKIEEARGLRRAAMEEASSLVVSVHLPLSGSENVDLGSVLTLDEDREAVVNGKLYPQTGIKGFGQGLFAREAVDSTQTTYKMFNRLYEGALVLSQVKGWEGAIAVCPPAFAGRYASPEYRTFRCIPGRAVPEYMAALVTTPWFLDRLRGLSRGVGARRERTRPEQFLGLRMPMPPVEAQRWAVSILAGLTPIRHLQSGIESAFDSLLPAVLDRAFRGEL